MSDVMSMIEGKITQLQTELQNAKTYLSQINEAIEKLTSDRKSITEQVLGMNGALQAYNSTIVANKTSNNAVGTIVGAQ
jgi:peptidoglycan hydrolase CwlO-like protein